MSEGQTHTPGPWEFSTTYSGRSEVYIGADESTGGHCVVHSRAHAADAHLIAAAPEMLEALQDMIAGMGHIKDCGPTVEKARAAIAKAEGGAS